MGTPHLLDEQLRASTAVAWLAGNDEPAPTLVAECARIGATLTCDGGGDGGAPAVRVAVPHTVTDAYGLLYLLSRFGRWAGEAPSLPERAPLRRTHDDGNSSLHVWRAAPTTRRPTTVTQRLLAALAPRLAAAGVTHISLVIGRPATNARSAHDYRRNDFLPVDFDVAALQVLAAAPRDAWRAALDERARRIERLAARSPTLLLRSRAQLMISAVGDVGRHPWIGEAITPSRVQMVATPWRRETLNLVTWSRGDEHALSLSGEPEHPLWREAPSIARAWEATLDDA